ncbi:hypothetical protein ACLOJK_036320, partial [Asimina triloba]
MGFCRWAPSIKLMVEIDGAHHKDQVDPNLSKFHQRAELQKFSDFVKVITWYVYMYVMVNDVGLDRLVTCRVVYMVIDQHRARQVSCLSGRVIQ